MLYSSPLTRKQLSKDDRNFEITNFKMIVTYDFQRGNRDCFSFYVFSQVYYMKIYNKYHSIRENAQWTNYLETRQHKQHKHKYLRKIWQSNNSMYNENSKTKCAAGVNRFE